MPFSSLFPLLSTPKLQIVADFHDYNLVVDLL